MALYLGVDIGTSAIKATVVDESGKAVKHARIPCKTTNPGPGFYEVEPLEVWWNGFLKICELMRRKIDVSQIRSLCVSSVCGSFVPVNDRLDPVHNAILYGIDTRSTAQIERLNRRYGKERLDTVLGGVFTTHSVIPKILWLREEKPDVYEEARFFLESCNFVTARLTGETAWDFPTASGSLLVDLTTLSQPASILADLAIEGSKIPAFKWPLEVLGEISEGAAELTGLNVGTAVMTGACDVNAEALACGAVSAGDMVVVYGSTVSTLLILDRLSRLDGFVTGVSFLEGSYRFGGATSSGGRLLAWVDGLFSSREQAIPVPVKPTGILMLPYPDGARTPFHDPNAKIVWFGMTGRTTNEEIRISAREALGFELALVLRKLGTVASIPECLHAMGGLSNDVGLVQIVSNVTGRAQKTFPAVDASYGDALAAMTIDVGLPAIARLEGVTNARGKGQEVYPTVDLHDEYIPLVGKFEALYRSVRELF